MNQWLTVLLNYVPCQEDWMGQHLVVAARLAHALPAHEIEWLQKMHKDCSLCIWWMQTQQLDISKIWGTRTFNAGSMALESWLGLALTYLAMRISFYVITYSFVETFNKWKGHLNYVFTRVGLFFFPFKILQTCSQPDLQAIPKRCWFIQNIWRAEGNESEEISV